MHPYTYAPLITERQSDLARAAEREKLHGRPLARHQMRRNAGWLLVHLGLRLALGRTASFGA
ncbi:MAG TPA: hypothetical protein VMH35_24300 [Streptosporangiaceae bacterium]|nr:hypothetical protein [Streptosporangiaceae bacterium]